jgi:hypothetical protein
LTTDNTYFIDVGMSQDIALIYPVAELEFFNKRDDAVWTSSDGESYTRRYNVSATLFEHFTVDSLRIYTFDDPRWLNYKYIIEQNFLKRFNVFFDLKNQLLGFTTHKEFSANCESQPQTILLFDI